MTFVKQKLPEGFKVNFVGLEGGNHAWKLSQEIQKFKGMPGFVQKFR